MAQTQSTTGIRIWLLITAFMVFSMVAIGGLTRLTRSGLSIVEWKPISGILPPLTEEAWHAEFESYKQYPEYQKINQGMQLEDFKFIYYWEYGHRLLGRLIGFVFAVPLLVFALQKKVRGTLAFKLVMALILGGAQGVLGWWMVKSGLVDRPSVSHFRLAAHLLLALFLMCFLYWVAMDLRAPLRRHLNQSRLRPLSIAFLGLVSLQIFYGALTAGLHAGHMYNTFPTMNGLWIPQGIGSMGPVLDFLENPVTVQFVHRCLGWLVLFSAVGLYVMSRKEDYLSARQKWSFQALLVMVLVQFALGVFTLLYRVPVALGSLHQIGACILLLLTVNAVHAMREARVGTLSLVRQAA
ncbi:COX15/CtaA family protein [Oligoflexus tunisiensis]|uniref:COX15/CtaA family protein n=1 Tax=Oligoflexus tunisiensis TaxID=708132 RepID=UPI000AA03F30|nr:COX15/CtaA family protein [Oligoflexus tunisiensis]